MPVDFLAKLCRSLPSITKRSPGSRYGLSFFAEIYSATSAGPVTAVSSVTIFPVVWTINLGFAPLSENALMNILLPADASLVERYKSGVDVPVPIAPESIIKLL